MRIIIIKLKEEIMNNITMFVIGFIIFCAYLFTLFSIIIKANNAQQKELENDPELKKHLKK